MKSFTDLLAKNADIIKAIGHGNYWNFRFLEKTIGFTEEEKAKYMTVYKETFCGEDTEQVDLDLEETEYELVEVYYDKNDEIIAWTSEATQIWCENIKDLKELLKKAKKASYRNTVVIEDGKMRDSGRKMNKSWKI